MRFRNIFLFQIYYLLFLTDSDSDSDRHSFDPFNRFDMELCQNGFRGFTQKSMKKFVNKCKNKKFVEKLQKFYSNQ